MTSNFEVGRLVKVLFQSPSERVPTRAKLKPELGPNLSGGRFESHFATGESTFILYLLILGTAICITLVTALWTLKANILKASFLEIRQPRIIGMSRGEPYGQSGQIFNFSSFIRISTLVDCTFFDFH